MDSYQIVVIALILLAVADLIVGVSNDAVNFLNSAIGSRVAKRNVILIIAGAGVLLGAIASSGMMEIARKGIFNPEVFSFAEVMVIFVAVMVADILLLDFFNTLGLPTSTTVSIVFDLLGASVAVAILKSMADESGLAGVEAAINHSTAIAIISGIFLSIGVAFTIGALVQYVCRLWFSFRFDKYLNSFGVIFAGVSITVIIYFILIKGAKGSKMLSNELVSFISSNTLLLLAGILLFSILVVFILRKVWGTHPLKLVVFCGTFALAMAFAGNDLVNFIGVPLAGYQSFQIWNGSGVGADLFMMDQLGEAVQTPFLFLLLAGAIMVLTLWLSAKARKVTETEVNLGRQDSGDERFQPNFLSRVIVGGALGFGSWMSRHLPDALVRRMNLRFNPRMADVSESDKPAFDLVRASVNLIIASFLIALATSYKLPLSTTYVSFMVAMGTSLADRAWGRESAVYRVSGVLNVIGGWLVTALMAFFTAGIIATAIYYGGPWIGIGLSLLALYVFVSSNLRFNKREKVREKLRAREVKPEKQEKLFEVLKEDIQRILVSETHIIDRTFAYLKQDGGRKSVRKIKDEWKDFDAEVSILKKAVQKVVLKKSSHSEEYGMALLYNMDHLKDVKSSLDQMVRLIIEHEKNHQALPAERYMKNVYEVQKFYSAYSGEVTEQFQKNSFRSSETQKMKKDLQERIHEVMNEILIFSSQKVISYKQAVTLTEYLLILKNIVAIKARLIKSYQREESNESIMESIIS